MKTNEFITSYYLRSQRIKLLRWSLVHRAGGCQLALANGVHGFYASDRTPGCPKGLEPEHGTREPFHCSMVLLHDVIQVLGVSDKDGGLVRLVVALNCCRVAATPGNGDR